MEQADPSTRTPVLEISLLVCWMAAFHDKFHLVFLVVSFWSPLSRRLWSPFSRGLLFSSPSGLSIASPQPTPSATLFTAHTLWRSPQWNADDISNDRRGCRKPKCQSGVLFIQISNGIKSSQNFGEQHAFTANKPVEKLIKK